MPAAYDDTQTAISHIKTSIDGKVHNLFIVPLILASNRLYCCHQAGKNKQINKIKIASSLQS
jgi:hypothetical protein